MEGMVNVITQIIGAILATIALIFPTGYAVGKRKLMKIIKEGADVLEQTAELIVTVKISLDDIRKALEDDKVTKEEVQRSFEDMKRVMEESEELLKEFNEFVDEIKNLVS